MLDVWAVGRYDLRLSDRDIAALNMREYVALVKRKEIAERKARLNAGIVAAAIYNSAPGDPNRTAINPYMFVPGWKEEQGEQIDLTKLGPEEQAKYIAKIFGSSVVRKK